MARGGRGFTPGVGTGFLAGAVSSGQGSGGALFGSCSVDDQSFFCRLSRFTSSVSMIIYLVAVIAVIFYGIKYLRKK